MLTAEWRAAGQESGQTSPAAAFVRVIVSVRQAWLPSGGRQYPQGITAGRRGLLTGKSCDMSAELRPHAIRNDFRSTDHSNCAGFQFESEL